MNAIEFFATAACGEFPCDDVRTKITGNTNAVARLAALKEYSADKNRP